jgi:hypothetical protein
MPPEEVRKQLLIIEEEIRPMIRLPGCSKCASLGIRQLLAESAGRVVVGPQQMEMAVWSCPREGCDYTVPLPPGAFPQHIFKIVKLHIPNEEQGPEAPDA